MTEDKIPVSMDGEDLALTCLEIMARGEDMLAVGTWEAPIRRLAMRGWAVRVGNGFRITDKGKAALARAEAELPERMRTTPVEQSLWKVFSVDGIGGTADRTGLVVLRRNDLTTSGYEALVQPRAVAVDLNQRYGLEGSLVNAPHPETRALLQAMLDCAWRMGLRPTDGPS